ncbi:MAG: aminotransferase class I/II-fold pyridoxal phosphate-dependent enzyme [Actinomycetota bacterium]
MAAAEVRSLDQLRRLTGVKWTRHPADVLPAWVADMDLAPPPFAVDAVRDLADRGDFGYNADAAEELPALFRDWQRTHHGWEPDLDRLVLFNDVLHAIVQSIWHHTGPGDGIVLLTPIYPPFIAAVEGSGRRVVDVPLERDGWRLDEDRLRSAIDDGTTAILLCNPHNPTGRAFDERELDAIGRVAVDRDLLLISDEVWADLTHPGAVHRPSALVDPAVAARTVTISSASKAFNLAGLRSAVAHVGHDALAERFAGLPRHFLGATSTPGAEAARRCWAEGASWLSETRTYLTERRDQLTARVRADLPEVWYQPPEATYLTWLDFGPLGLPDEPREWLFDHARVALSPGPDFGPHGVGFVRINVATSPRLLDEVLDRIVASLASRA